MVFRAALKKITDDSLQELVLADANHPIGVIRAQERVKVCSDLIGELSSVMDLYTANRSRTMGA